MECVQKKCTRILPGLKGISNDGTLIKPVLFFSGASEIEGNLIKVYKIIRGIDLVTNLYKVGHVKYQRA